MNEFIVLSSKFFNTILLLILDCFHVKRSDEQKERQLEFIKFCVVGFTNTVIAFVIYVISLKTLQGLKIFTSADYLISNVISWVLSVFWSFIWNRKCVFQTDNGTNRSFLQDLLKSYCSYALTGLLLNNVMLFFLVTKLEMGKVVALLFVLPISIPANFLLHKFWIFRKGSIS
ncbi:GtrA family protein [bacterium]|nr:GtrA family protein [bacterium]